MMTKRFMAGIWAVLIAVLLPLAVMAGVPQTINYQGYLTDAGGTPVNESKSIVFSFYNVPTGGTALWTETQPTVAVTKGVYSVVLGSVTPISTLVFNNTNLYIGITIGTDPEMVPRQKLSSVGFAYKAVSADFAANADTVDFRHADEFVLKSGDSISGTLGVNTLYAGTLSAGGGGSGPTAVFEVVDGARIEMNPGADGTGIYVYTEGPGYAADLRGNVNVSGSVTAGSFIGNGSGLTNIILGTHTHDGSGITSAVANATDADTVDGQHADAFSSVTHGHDTTYVKLNGNAGPVWVGTTDNSGISFVINSVPVLEIKPTAGAPNLTTANVLAGVQGATSLGSTSTVFDNYGTVSGGEGNMAGNVSGTTQSEAYATVGGGYENMAGAMYATVGGGYHNAAMGSYSYAGGRQAKANHQGTYVWADSTAADFASTGNDQFLVRAAGGVGINKDNPTTALDVNGTVTATSFVGSGSGLTNVTPGVHTHDTYVQKAGDIMSGALSLPADGLTVGGTQLVLSGGKVGVGTTPSTAAKFQVANNDVSGQGAYIAINNIDNSLPAMYAHTVGSGQAVYGRTQGTGRAGDFQIANTDSTASALYAKTTGTGYAAEIDGKARVTGALEAGSISTTAGNTNFATTSGNVGVGTVNPTEKLEVAGTVKATALTTTGNANFATTSGNVGIGTQAPSEKLDVAGTVKATTFSGSGSALTSVNATTLNGQSSSEIIAAASDESRTPISACGVTINAPGSYYVTQNLTTTGGTCITVSMENVTLDLMGFALYGQLATSVGIYISFGPNVEIRNGMIANFNKAIDTAAASDTIHSHRVLDVSVKSSNHGIQLRGENNLVKGCTVAYSAMGTGINLSNANGSIIANNIVHNNAGYGIVANGGSSVVNNSAYKNVAGISATGGSVENNIVSYNDGIGIQIDGGSAARNVVKYNNQANAPAAGGIVTTGAGQVSNNMVQNNLYNNIVVVSSGNILEYNFVSGSTNGILFNAPDNFYDHNRARGNTNNFNLNGFTQNWGSNDNRTF